MYIQKGNESDIILPCYCEEQRGLRRGNLAERNAPDGWIPTVTSFPRNDKGGTPTPDCHVERSRNISWKGNDVNYRKIVCLVGAPDGWIPTVTSFPRNDNRVGHPHPNGYSFRAYLLTECATSKTEHEPQGGENMSAELDGCTVRLRRVVA